VFENVHRENASFYLSDWLVLLYHILVWNATKRRMVARFEPQANKKFFDPAIFQKCWRGVGEQCH